MLRRLSSIVRGQGLELLLLLSCALILRAAPSQAGAAKGSDALRLDSAVDAILPADARVETLFERDSIFDGPTWVGSGSSGYLIFSDVPGNVIDELHADGRVTTFLQNVFAGHDASQAYQSFGLNGQKRYRMPGADGVTLDRQGRVVYCSYSAGEIIRLETNGRRTVLASRFAGRRLNAPNDLVYKSDGSLYFTDSRAATKHPQGDGVPHEGLYVLRGGQVLLLSQSIDHPNGVAFSPDEKYLYVTNTLRKNVLRFSVTAGGIADERVFADMSSVDGPGVPDGIKVDEAGNVYATGPGGVWVISPGGRHIGTILTPAKVTNMTFGDQGLRTLYMTGFGALYRIHLKVAGR